MFLGANVAWETAENDVGGDREDGESSEQVSIHSKGVLSKVVGLGVHGASFSNIVVSIDQSHDGHDKVDIVEATAVNAIEAWSESLPEGSNNQEERLDSYAEESIGVEAVHHGPAGSFESNTNSPVS